MIFIIELQNGSSSSKIIQSDQVLSFIIRYDDNKRSPVVFTRTQPSYIEQERPVILVVFFVDMYTIEL